mgnify:CR=1 FL=1
MCYISKGINTHFQSPFFQNILESTFLQMDTAVEKQSRAIVVSSLFILVNIFFRQHYFRFRRCWQCSNKHRYIPTKKQKYSKRKPTKKIGNFINNPSCNDESKDDRKSCGRNPTQYPYGGCSPSTGAIVGLPFF